MEIKNKSLKKGLKDIWVQFLAEVVKPFFPGIVYRMSFTRKIGLVDKVNTLNKLAWKKA